jgi:hypothetical protein
LGVGEINPMTPEIQEFGKLLVQWVRDAAVESSDMLLRSDVNDPAAIRWRTVARRGSPTDLASLAIPDVVDATIFQLLHAIDDGALDLTFTASNGKKVNLNKEGLGELAGSFLGDDGWRALYTKQRFVDDFADLELPDDLKNP